MVIEDKKRLARRLGWAILLLSIGTVIGAVGVIALLASRQTPEKSEEQVRREYVIEYTEKEQAALGIDCKKLKSSLRDFLEMQIRPVLSARQAGQGWSSLVSDDLRKKVAEYRDYYFACSRLYLAGRNGQWNGLSDLGFTVDLNREIIDLHTLVRFGEPRRGCDAGCLDRHFQELQDAYNKLEASARP